MVEGLNDFAQQIHSLARDKGFWGTPPRDALAVLFLIISEATEAGDEYRDGHPLNEERYGENGKPEGFPSEMADIIIRVLDACGAWNIDIEKALKEKFEYNKKRPILHGRVH